MSDTNEVLERRSVIKASDLNLLGLRLTNFPVKPIDPAFDFGWWRSVTGSPPLARIADPKQGGVREGGDFKDARLVVSLKPARIDWELGVPIERQQQEEPILHIGPLEVGLRHFADAIKAWFLLKNYVHARRLAFGAVLLYRVSDIKEGYAILSKYLPSVSLDPDNSSDFFYQINRPAVSKVGIKGLKLNKLSKWSIQQEKVLLIRLDKSKFDVNEHSDEYSLRIELDINTSQDYSGQFDGKASQKVFNELISTAQMIAERGEMA